MAKTTHKKTSKKSGLAKTAAKRLSKRSRTESKSVAARNGVAQKRDDLLKQVDKANAHLMKAVEMIREDRARERTPGKPHKNGENHLRREHLNKVQTTSSAQLRYLSAADIRGILPVLFESRTMS